MARGKEDERGTFDKNGREEYQFNARRWIRLKRKRLRACVKAFYSFALYPREGNAGSFVVFYLNVVMATVSPRWLLSICPCYETVEPFELSPPLSPRPEQQTHFAQR